MASKKAAKVIALDFDGVVADTENECYVISIPAFRRMGEKIEDNKHVRREFRKGRPYVKHADCYYTVLKILQDPKANFGSISLEEFSKERDKNKKKGEEFHKLFYVERAKLQKSMKKWIKLNPPFEEPAQAVKRLTKSFPIVIVTSKDKLSTKLLLESYGLHAEDDNILPKEFSMDKRDHMKFIADKFGVSLNDIVFVEDNLEQLLRVKELGVKLVLVDWGYNTSEQRKDAKKQGVKVVSVSNFEKIVRSI